VISKSAKTFTDFVVLSTTCHCCTSSWFCFTSLLWR